MPDDVSFTDRELDLMSVLWKLGSGTVTEIRDQLRGEAGYTSVLKICQVLEDKGHVRHEVEGRAYRYFPTVASEAAGRTALGKIVDKIFHGSAEMTLARLVEERPISEAELDRMHRILDELALERRNYSKGGGS
jgi:predicted transcriptional regulator